ncbi:MAG: phosphoglucosamine mutase [Oscillospiraceae bacterium]|nr:phosphoglucosamine mutase [Oscillospiraceae bacterium]
MGRLFGADSAVKGEALTDISCELAMAIGRACAYELSKKNHRRAKILIGKDTRSSCKILKSSLIAGILAAGGDADLLGVVPTPAVAYLTVKYGADAGIMVSASHNSYEFNGIRIFSASGDKLNDAIEAEIERLVLDSPEEVPNADSGSLGDILTEKNAEWDYVRYLLRDIQADLGRLRIVVDCANGAAYETAVKFFRGLGINAKFLNTQPNGVNINADCGTEDLTVLSRAVTDSRAHCGIALDGDGSRCLMVDEKGEPVDPDKMLAALAYFMKQEKTLSANTCVVTRATNLGFFKWAKDNGIVTSTASGVSERSIHERLMTDGYSLGADGSGKFLFGNLPDTADGELASAKMLEVMAKSGRKLSEIAGIFTPYPTIDVDVKIRHECKNMWDSVPEITEMLDYCSEKLAGDGRIYIRESTAEPLIRVTAEGRDEDIIYQYAQAAAQTVMEHIGELDQE